MEIAVLFLIVNFNIASAAGFWGHNFGNSLSVSGVKRECIKRAVRKSGTDAARWTVVAGKDLARQERVCGHRPKMANYFGTPDALPSRENRCIIGLRTSSLDSKEQIVTKKALLPFMASAILGAATMLSLSAQAGGGAGGPPGGGAPGAAGAGAPGGGAAGSAGAKLDDQKNVFFMNINDKFLDPQGGLISFRTTDHLHPVEQGFDIWLSSVAPTLKGWAK